MGSGGRDLVSQLTGDLAEIDLTAAASWQRSIGFGDAITINWQWRR